MIRELSPDSEFFLPEPPAGMRLLDEIPQRAMVVCAHPDDAEIGCGATLAKWSAGGCEIALVVCTAGRKGLPDDAQPDVRMQEQQRASGLLGVETTVLLAGKDGALEDEPLLRGAVVEQIRRHSPEILLTHDPVRSWGFLHRDHRIAGTVAIDAVYPYARDRLHYSEQIRAGLHPHKVREAWLWGGDTPTGIVDVSGFVARQANALMEHRSQVAGLGSPPAEIEGALLARAVRTAKHHRFEHGEDFRRLIARI